MDRAWFLLVDGDNFYVACERLFNPRLAGRPVVVLSNNDGCVVARSPEAKALGIAMGAPAFRWRDAVSRGRLVALSSNYPLYADISRRVNEVLAGFGLPLEQYSIDESFLAAPGGSAREIEALAAAIRTRVVRWVGVPVSIGAAATKTLAKLAAEEAKKGGGVTVAAGPEATGRLLAHTPAAAVWGIGRQSARKLAARGIDSAADLRNAPGPLVRELLGRSGARTACELAGQRCFTLETAPPPPGEIRRSATFGQPVREEEPLRQAIAGHLARAAVKLRARKLAAGTVSVFLATSRFRPGGGLFAQATAEIARPTALTPALITLAGRCLAGLYRPGHDYNRAGVILGALCPDRAAAAATLFAPSRENDRPARLLREVDRLNRRWGQDTIRFAAAGTSRPWAARGDNRSPGYTTRWSDLPEARAGQAGPPARGRRCSQQARQS